MSEEEKERLLGLSEEIRLFELENIAMIWKENWKFLETCYYGLGINYKDIEKRKEVYFNACRKELLEFGYIMT